MNAAWESDRRTGVPRRRRYLELLGSGVYLSLYIVVLFYQRDPSTAHQVCLGTPRRQEAATVRQQSARSQAAPVRGSGAVRQGLKGRPSSRLGPAQVFNSLSALFPKNFDVFASNADALDLIGGLVNHTWVDSVCGDGECAFNTREYPAFGTRFGCPTDCGLYSDGRNLTDVEVAVRPVFGRNDLTSPAMQAEFLERRAGEGARHSGGAPRGGREGLGRCGAALRCGPAAYGQHSSSRRLPSPAQDQLEHLLPPPLVGRRRHGVLVRPSPSRGGGRGLRGDVVSTR